MEGYIAEIRFFAGNFPPRGWQFCQGQVLLIAQNTAVFALLGTSFGGNGQTTFALPDLRGRVAIGAGQAPGRSSYNVGQQAGSPQRTLTNANLPGHTHTISGSASMPVSGEDGHKASPINNFPAVNGEKLYSNVSDGSTMAPAVLALTTGPVGTPNPQPIENMKPYLGMNYIICLEGIFPSRN